VLRQFVADRLEKRWSPEQVSQALRREFPDEPARHVVHETIYQAVYRPELGGLSRELPARVLRTRRRQLDRIDEIRSWNCRSSFPIGASLPIPYGPTYPRPTKFQTC